MVDDGAFPFRTVVARVVSDPTLMDAFHALGAAKTGLASLTTFEVPCYRYCLGPMGTGCTLHLWQAPFARKMLGGLCLSISDSQRAMVMQIHDALLECMSGDHVLFRFSSLVGKELIQKMESYFSWVKIIRLRQAAPTEFWFYGFSLKAVPSACTRLDVSGVEFLDSCALRPRTPSIDLGSILQIYNKYVIDVGYVRIYPRLIPCLMDLLPFEHTFPRDAMASIDPMLRRRSLSIQNATKLVGGTLSGWDGQPSNYHWFALFIARLFRVDYREVYKEMAKAKDFFVVMQIVSTRYSQEAQSDRLYQIFGISKADVDLVSTQTQVQEERAIRALIANNGQLVEAILEISGELQL